MNELRKTLAAKERYDIADLLAIMETLRAPDGCPWDAEQTHKTIRQNFIEETYEVVEAIDTEDMTLLREELGDVLLQVVFHARMAEEAGVFSFADVANDICAKLVHRHPHVFGTVQADTAEQVLTNWDTIKQQEKKRKSLTEELSGISRALPALMRARKVAHKLAKRGHAFACPYADMDTESAKIAIGEALFALCAAADKLEIDPEEALTRASDAKIATVEVKQ